MSRDSGPGETSAMTPEYIVHGQRNSNDFEAPVTAESRIEAIHGFVRSVQKTSEFTITDVTNEL